MLMCFFRPERKSAFRSCRSRLRRCTRAALLVGVALISADAAVAQSAPRTFAMPVRLFQVGPQPNAIAARDLTDDGLPDIVTADRGTLYDPREERPANDEISVLIADQAFDYTRRHPSLKTGFGPYALAIANVDGLKYPDIIAVNFHATRHRDVSVFLNLKDEGVFKPLEFRVPDEHLAYHRHQDGDGIPLYTVPGLTSVAVADLTGDGLRDLAATAWSADVLVIMPGHRDLIFGEPRLLPAAGAPRDLAVADLDGDTVPDLAVVHYTTGQVSLWKGDGAGGFSEQTRFSTRGNLPTTVRVQDMNGDGRPDIIVSHSHTDDSIVLFYGESPWSYPLSQDILLGSDRAVLEHEIRDIVVADLNTDGRPDIAAACFASATVMVLMNEGAPAGAPCTFRREVYTFNEGRPRALCSADFDNDGRPDIAVALWEVNAVGLMRNVR